MCANLSHVTLLARAALPQYVVTHEHPGVVSVWLDDNVRWVFGTANELWGGDLLVKDRDNNDMEETLKSAILPIPSSHEDAETCAIAIVDFITGGTDRHRDLHRCLRELTFCFAMLDDEGTTRDDGCLADVLYYGKQRLEEYLART